MQRKRNGIYIAGFLLMLLFTACAPKEAVSDAVQSQEMVESTQGVMPSAEPENSGKLAVTPTWLPTPTVAPSPTPIPTLTPTPVPAMSVVMVGDVLLHTRVLDGALLEDGTYDFSSLFANVTDEIQAADLAIVNQEVILGGSELGVSGYPRFNAPYEAGDALVAAGFDLVCHATNHALDKGKEGLLNCINFWKEEYPEIGVAGIYESEEARDSIFIYEQNGITVAVLNYTYGTNGAALPKDMPYAVSLLTEEQVIADLKRADELADFVIVTPHWGKEYVLEPVEEQRRWAELFREYGADLVIGTHPHVIEPAEWNEEMLIYYSIGNFANWTSGRREGTANRMIGGMAEITLERAKDGTVVIADYGVTPLVCHVEEGKQKVTVYTLYEYTEELAGQNAIRKQDKTFTYEYCVELCDKVWGELWRKND